ncbi:MAG: glycosyltransferase family 2 protein [Microgenomates group bacterium]|nr:glycosyltransferase family 2 protein [Microgenomates group bacterium]
MSKPFLSIIIVSYNTKKLTLACLASIYRSLKNSSLNYEIIVVDNNSQDGTINELKKFKKNQSNLKLIINEDNLGFAKANNLAVKEALGEYLLFLNSDIIVLNRAIEKLFNFYKQNYPSFNFLGGKLLNKDLSDQPSAAFFYTLPVIFLALFLKGDYWGLTRFSPNKAKQVDWVSGACLLTNKNDFNKINGFDENIFMYMDEVDLLYRAKKAGLITYYYPEAKFIHYGSASSKGRTYPIIQVFRGLLFFYRKHYSKTSLFILKFMLKLKSIIAIRLGKITNNNYLVETYEKAYQMVKLA